MDKNKNKLLIRFCLLPFLLATGLNFAYVQVSKISVKFGNPEALLSKFSKTQTAKKAVSQDIQAVVFESNLPFPLVPLDEMILGGLYRSISFFLVSFWKNIGLGALVLGITFAGINCISMRKRRVWTIFSILLVSITGILSTLYACELWDEVHINLRHSYNLAHFNIFSVNQFEPLEGTVDFLPFLIVGLISKLGFEPLNVLLCLLLPAIPILGFAVYQVVLAITSSFFLSYFLSFFVMLLPPVLASAASGFTSVLFAACIVWGVYLKLIRSHFFVSNNPKICLKSNYFADLFLGFLSWIRIEGILLCCLIFICILVRLFNLKEVDNRQKVKCLMWQAILMFGPFLLLSGARYFYFGYFFPLCLAYKATGFDLAYVLVGIFNFIETMKYNGVHKLAWMFCLVSVFSIRSKKKDMLPLLKILLITFLFILPYHWGGGDWFPIAWARYSLSFIIFYFITLFGLSFFLIQESLQKHSRGKRIEKYSSVLSVLLIMIALLVPLKYAPAGFLSQKSILFRKDKAKSLGRIVDLASVGLFLRHTLPESAFVASPEVATLMYFSRREMVDLLGLSNPDIAFRELNPIVSGNLMHRKRNPKTIELRNFPDVIVLWEMISFILPKDRLSTSKEIKEFIQMQRYDSNQAHVAVYLMGSYKRLERLGYRLIIVKFKDYILNYFVHEKVWEAHIKKISSLYDSHYLGFEKIHTTVNINNQFLMD